MTKFKVGDWVELEMPLDALKNKQKFVFHVLETNVQKCEAGIEQVTYLGRIRSDYPTAETWDKQIRVREMELGKLIKTS